MHETRAGTILRSFPPAPRAVRRKTRRGGCGLAIVRLLILPHTLLGIALLMAIPVELYVLTLGTPVTATVDGRRTHRAKRGRMVYTLELRYEVDNRIFRDSASVKEQRYIQTQIGERLEGRAASLLGHGMFMGPSWTRTSILMLCGVAIFWNGIVWFFVYHIWVVPMRLRRLVKHGKPAPGTISAKHVIRGKNITYQLEYAFVTAEGQTAKGKTMISSEASAQAVVGGAVTVLYNPRRPQWNLPYEFSDFEIMPAMER